jgi:SAM-dependent methyltransferase
VQRFWHRNKLTLIRRLMPLAGGAVLVDIGCGSGNLTFEGGRSARLAVGLDASRPSLRFCAGRSAGTRCTFAGAYVEALPLVDGCADAALLVEVVEHLEAPEGALAEVLRVLRPGGQLLVTTPNYAFPSLWPALEWFVDHSGRVPRMAGEQHVRKFRPETLEALLQACGFHVQRLGTFYHLSPFLAVLSGHLADAWAAHEIDGGGRAGALIYSLARRPDSSRMG